MKNNAALLLFLLSIYTAFSLSAATTLSNDNNDYRLARLVYSNSSGENGITFFDYNENNLSDVALWELVNGERYSLNFHFYDENNNLIRKSREFSDHRNTVQIFKYDDRNRLVSEEFIRTDTSRGVSTFGYDAADRLVLINCNAYNGWINGKIKIYYEQNGQRKNGELMQNGKTAADIKYIYDGNGNLKSEIWEFANGWNQTFLYEYEKRSALKISFTQARIRIYSVSMCR